MNREDIFACMNARMFVKFDVNFRDLVSHDGIERENIGEIK